MSPRVCGCMAQLYAIVVEGEPVRRTCKTTGMAHCRWGITTLRLAAAFTGGAAVFGASDGGTGGGSAGANLRSDRSMMCISWYMSCRGPRPPTFGCARVTVRSSEVRVTRHTGIRNM